MRPRSTTSVTLVAALKVENRKLHKRLATLEAQTVSLKNEVAALRQQIRKGIGQSEDLGERLRRARKRMSSKG